MACGLMLVVVTGMVLWHHGAALGPPAEPLETFGAARPEWYYLFLFQLLKKFENEFIGAIVVPAVVMLFLFSMPLVANRIRFAHIVNVVMLFVLLGGAGYLTYEAIHHDGLARQELNPPENVVERALYFERREASQKFIVSQAQAQREFERARELVEFFGIPKEGAASGLLKHDPEIQGPRLFARHCASCHSYEDPQSDDYGNKILGPPIPRDEQGEPLVDPPPYGAPNLYGFANRDWFRRILDPTDQGLAGRHMFGSTVHRDGEMVTFVQEELTDLSDEQQMLVDDIVVALSAEAKLKDQQQADQVALQDGTIQRGIEALGEAIDSQSCLDCHCFHNDEGGMAPDLSNYGSLDWLTSFIADPQLERFYGYDSEMNDRMPSFAKHPHDPKLNLLTPREIDLIARWLRGDDRDLGNRHLQGQLAL
jgi:ubiquinol-cytochrome c reductase cytochrome b subunit